MEQNSKLTPQDYWERIKYDTKKLIKRFISLLINIVLFIVTLLRSDKRIAWGVSIVFALLCLFFIIKSCAGGSKKDDAGIEQVVVELEPSDRVKRPEKAHRISKINYRRAFNDMNDEQLVAAKRIGIEPIASREDINNVSRRVVETDDHDAYVLEKLTHSMPYLVPEAAKLLSDIGRNFQDSLVMKHLPPAKIIVTSVLRTKSDVKRLSRGNVNASKNSTHCYATTFDITYARFYNKYGKNPNNAAQMKAVLAEVLRDLKKEGRCYVKHEKKQPCFHITARK